MARTKNREEQLLSKTEEIATSADKKVFRTVIYIRLSHEDERKIESNTVENQKLLLEQYVSSQKDMVYVDSYCDRGFSGTNFDRPDFTRMMEDMKKDKFDCIVVKDLSRIGRNYLETGNYIEHIFPFFHIRLVCVIDQYDSLYAKSSEEGMIVPLKNLINEAYAKDISQKICSAKEAKQKKGIFIGKAAPYGYRKAGKNQPVQPNPDNMHIVQMIFRKRAEGVSIQQIVRELNADGVETPMQYRYRMGIDKTDKHINSPWDNALVSAILVNAAYIGDMEQGYQKQSLHKGIPVHRQKKDKHIYVPNTHEGIIDRELFYKVQELVKEQHDKSLAVKDKYKHLHRKEDIFKGILYCGDCNIKLNLYRRTVMLNSGPKNYYTYLCRNTAQYSDERCRKKNFKMSELEDVIATLIREHIRIYLDKETILQKLNGTPVIRSEKDIMEEEIASMEKEIAKLDARSQNLYHDYQDEVISEKEYLSLKKTHLVQKEEIMEQCMCKKEQMQTLSADYHVDEKLSGNIKEYVGFTELTKEVISAFIEKIDVYYGKRIQVTYTFQDVLAKMDKLIEERMVKINAGTE